MLKKTHMLVLKSANATITAVAMVVYLMAPIATLVPQIASAHTVGSNLNFAATAVSGSAIQLSWTSTSDVSPSTDQHNLTLWYCTGAGCTSGTMTEIYDYSGHDFTTANTGLNSGTIYSGTFIKTGLTNGGTYGFKIREKHGGDIFEQIVADIIFIPPQCSDGLDNDGDGKIDFGSNPSNDLGCSSAADNNESDDPVVNPTLTLLKTVTNDNGGSATEDDFQAKIDGNNVAWGAQITLIASSHTASETNLAGYTASVWGGDCAADGTITLAAGENKTCTITNDDEPGTLHVIKEVINNNGGTFSAEDFTFSVDGGIETPFEDDGQNDIEVDAGTYSVTEPSADGYSTSYDNCADMAVPNGGDATCTITNDDIGGTLVIEKRSNGWFDTFHFTGLGGDNGFDIETTQDGQVVASFFDVFADIYNVAEDALNGWELTSATCDNGDDPSSVNVGLDKTVTCRFENEALPGTLTVIKHVEDGREGAPSDSDFTISVSGGDPGSFSGSELGTAVSMPAGTDYLVEETGGPSGYAASYSGDCGGIMPPGGALTCTVINTPTTGSLTVRKVWLEDNGGTASANPLTLTVSDYDDPSAFHEEVTSGQSIELEPGNYSVEENYVPGYTATYSGDCDEDGVLEMAEGESNECIITNDDIQPKLTVNKTVSDPKENYIPSFFDVFVDLSPVVVGETNGFNAGSHTVTESLAGDNSFPEGVGYAQDFGDACDEGGNVTLNPGDDVSCTITNTITYAACTDGLDNDGDGKIDFGGENPDPSCSSAEDQNENDTDETDPVSHFDGDFASDHHHQIIDTEIVQLSLVSQSTDNVGPIEEPKSGVKSAKMELFKLANAQTMDGEGFFVRPNEGLSPFESLSCSNLNEIVPIEIVALNLASAEPFSVSWGPQMTLLDRGVYCAVVNATDNAGNIEHTAIAGPFAYTFSPPPPPPPPPNPTSPPASQPSGGGGGNGIPGISGFAPTIPPQGGGPVSPSASLGGQVLGATLELPESCTPYLGAYIKLGRKNNPDEVKKLQTFLNTLGENLPVTGFYGPLSFASVKRFQVKEAAQILTPWQVQTGSIDPTGTGYVYKTTKRWINLLNCPELNLPMPQLP